MKTKNVFLSMGLAFLMGLAGCQSTGPLMAKAATATTVYCAIGSSEIGSYSLKLNVNFKGDGNDWHQYDMTATGEQYESKNVYTKTFTDAHDGLGKLQFQLYDGSTWKEQDEVISSWTSVGTYNNKLHVYKGSGWVSYTPSVTPEPEPDPTCTVRGTVASLSLNADWATGEDVSYNSSEVQFELKNVQLATTDEFKFYLDNGPVWAGYDKVDAVNGHKELFVDTSSALEGANNLKVNEAGEYSFYVKTDGTIYAVKESVAPTPEPAAWHLLGTMNSWTAAESNALEAKDEDLPEDVEHQFYIQLVLAKDDEFKFNLDSTWLGYDSLQDAGAIANFSKNEEVGEGNNNIVVEKAGTYKFYLKQLKAGGYTIYAAEPQVDPSETKNTFYVWDMSGNLGDVVADINVYGFGQAYNVPEQVYPGAHEGVTAKEDIEGIEHLYQVQLSVSYPKFIINNGSGEGKKQTVNVDEIKPGQVFYIYNSTDGEGKYEGGWYSLDDLRVANGTYIRGDWAEGWSVAGQKVMHTHTDPMKSNEQVIEELLLSAGSKLKVVTYTDHVPTWHGAAKVYEGETDKTATNIDEDGNATVSANGSYNLYVDTNTWNYYFVATENDDLNKALSYVDAFHTALRAEGVCDVEHGTSTNVTNLATAWATLKEQYVNGTLSSGAKTLLAEGTANAELVAFASLYDMIIVKYSAQLGESPDFLNRNPVASNVVMMPVDNTYIVVLSIAATVTLVGLTAVILRKKKLAK